MIVAVFLLAAAAAQPGTKPPPPVLNPYGQWQPNVAYVIIGQDEAGYRAWNLADPSRVARVSALSAYLNTYRVGGIVPTWQLLRTASDWQKCGQQAFEVPPPEYWPNLVQTLRFIHEQVIPAVGPVEIVSGYRNPTLNQCAGGAQESAHRYYQAIDMVPLTPDHARDPDPRLVQRPCAARRPLRRRPRFLCRGPLPRRYAQISLVGRGRARRRGLPRRAAAAARSPGRRSRCRQSFRRPVEGLVLHLCNTISAPTNRG